MRSVERFDELELRVADECEQALGDLLVVDRVLDPIARRGATNVRRHFDIDDDALFDAALPFPNADDAFDAKRAEENLIHSLLEK